MPYFLVDTFGGGMDTRRNTAAPAGKTMREIRNAFINRGGEVERRRRWRKSTAISAALIDPALSNARGHVGPFASFRQDHLMFFGKLNPLADGSTWVTDGGPTLPFTVDNDFSFGIYPLPAFPTASYLRGVSEALFNGTQILGYAYDHASADAESEWWEVEYNNITFRMPDNDTALTNLDGTLPFGGTGFTPTGITSRFQTLWAAVPSRFLMRKHATADPASHNGIGSGEVDLRGQGVAVGRPLAMMPYYSQMAVFCEYGVQFWNIDADFSAIAYGRTIPGDRFTAYRTPVPYQGGDILYLTAGGVRSLRARDSSNFAVVDDVGSPIDESIVAALGDNDLMAQFAIGLNHTGLSQVWLFIGAEVYVLSRYSSSGVQAWSVYDLPAPTRTVAEHGDANAWAFDAAKLGSTICLRTGSEEVFTYGSTDVAGGDHYDTAQPTVVTTHYFGIEDPFTVKEFEGVDLICTGTWTVEYSLDPENEVWTTIYTGEGSTHGKADIRIGVHGNLIALRLTSNSASAATLSGFAIHYKSTEDQG